MQSLQLTAALILGCSALLFVNASAMPWAEDALPEADTEPARAHGFPRYGTPWAEDALPEADTEPARAHAFPRYGTPGSCCSPRIVKNPGAKKSSVIKHVAGYRGEVDLAVDFGSSNSRRRACNSWDYGFTVIVNWGDTTVDWSKAYFLGQFDMVHQYAKRDRTYDVTVHYCSTPNFVYTNQDWLSQGCCSTMTQTIDVTNNLDSMRLF